MKKAPGRDAVGGKRRRPGAVRSHFSCCWLNELLRISLLTD